MLQSITGAPLWVFAAFVFGGAVIFYVATSAWIRSKGLRAKGRVAATNFFARQGHALRYRLLRLRHFRNKDEFARLLAAELAETPTPEAALRIYDRAPRGSEVRRAAESLFVKLCTDHLGRARTAKEALAVLEHMGQAGALRFTELRERILVHALELVRIPDEATAVFTLAPPGSEVQKEAMRCFLRKTETIAGCLQIREDYGDESVWTHMAIRRAQEIVGDEPPSPVPALRSVA